ncbi:hypothetical protein B0H17DRAFT_1200367 [Mycena rosella]|uniref:Uncharacterized protein n=1 Tax=Mycena rosella TaxID=1033263 RepID=A0AAD7DII0_MYCRO|nr:hypothetical protein B0H17DRAFT_1200367 [Mycena rosella]
MQTPPTSTQRHQYRIPAPTAAVYASLTKIDRLCHDRRLPRLVRELMRDLLPKQNDVNANDEIGRKIHPAYGNAKGRHALNSKAPRTRGSWDNGGAESVNGWRRRTVFAPPHPPPRYVLRQILVHDAQFVLQALDNGLLTPPATQRLNEARREESSRADVQCRVTQIAGAAAGPFMAARCEYNETENRHDLGPMTVPCPHCAALHCVGSYSVVIQPARTLPTIEVYSQELTPVDYHAFGDIVWIIPLGSPEKFDMRHHAVVHVAGLATNVNEDDLTFEIHATQYVSATKTADNVFPKVTFLGPASVTPKAKESPTKLVNTGTPARLKFTGFFGSQGSDRKSGEPNPKKRKTADDRWGGHTRGAPFIQPSADTSIFYPTCALTVTQANLKRGKLQYSHRLLGIASATRHAPADIWGHRDIGAPTGNAQGKSRYRAQALAEVVRKPRCDLLASLRLEVLLVVFLDVTTAHSKLRRALAHGGGPPKYTGTRFHIKLKEIAYPTPAVYSPAQNPINQPGFVDNLRCAACARVPCPLQKLGVNAVRASSVDSAPDHDAP